MSFRAKRENWNSSEWTFLQERHSLLQRANYLKSGSRQRMLQKVESENNASASKFQDSHGCKSSENKKNDQKYQSICSILNKSKSLPYAKRPRDPEKFLAMHIASNRQITKEQLKHLDQLAKPKYVNTRSSQAMQLPNSGSCSAKLRNQNLRKPKSNASASMRLQNVTKSKSQSNENHLKAKGSKQMKQMQTKGRLVKKKVVTLKPNSLDIVEPSKVSLSNSAKKEQSIDKLAQPKIFMDPHKNKKHGMPGKVSDRLRRLAMPKNCNFHCSTIKL